MQLYSNIYSQILSLKLKSGFFTGILGISVVTGAFTVLENKDFLKNEINKYLNPIFIFLKTQLDPIQTGLVKIGETGKNWSLSVYAKKDSLTSWIMNNSSFIRVKNGGEKILESLNSWFSVAPSLLTQIYNWMTIENLKKMRKIISSMSNVSFELIKKLIPMIANAIEKIRDNPTFLSSGEGSIISSIMKIASSEQLPTIANNLLKTFSENTKAFNSFTPQNLATVLGFAASKPDELKSKIEELSSNTSNTSNTEGPKWGEYNSGDELVKALGLEQSQKKSKAAKVVREQYTVCQEGKTCDESDEGVLQDFFKLIYESVKKTNASGSSSSITELKVEDYFKDGVSKVDNILYKVFDKLFEFESIKEE